MSATFPPVLTPDTKDWTWVLDRPCPECGFDAAGPARDALAGLVRDSADAWAGRLGIAEGLRERPRPERWSVLEYGAHVRDVYRLADLRLGLMLGRDDPVFADWDQDASAVADRYDLADPALVAVGLASAAVRVASTLEAIGPAAWSRPGRRRDGAVFTVESFCRYLLHDPVHHLHDVGVAWGGFEGDPDLER